MDLKNARSRLATARTSLQKADSTMEVVRAQYEGHESMFDFLQRACNQLAGRVDVLIETMTTIIDTTEEVE